MLRANFSMFTGPALSAKGSKTGPPDDLDEGLTQEKLNQLHDLFEEMDEDGGGGLDIDEFKNAMRQTMGNISDKEIELIFMKVSAGSVFKIRSVLSKFLLKESLLSVDLAFWTKY